MSLRAYNALFLTDIYFETGKGISLLFHKDMPSISLSNYICGADGCASLSLLPLTYVLSVVSPAQGLYRLLMLALGHLRRHERTCSGNRTYTCEHCKHCKHCDKMFISPNYPSKIL